MPEGSKIQLLKNLCERERTQILTILILPRVNPCLVGYMIAGNHSVFLSTAGRIAWLQHCILMRSPPHVMNQFYDKIRIFYRNKIFFVDPITRQPQPDAQFQNCSDRIKNLFQFDVEDENSWFTVTPTPEHRKQPAVFEPKDVTRISRRTFGGARDAEIYTRAHLSEIRDKIYISAATRKALQKLSRDFIVFNTAILGPEQYSYYDRLTDFYVDHMVSPQLLQKTVYGHVGPIASVLEFSGIYFSCFLFIKHIVDLIVKILRHIETTDLLAHHLDLARHS